MKKTLLMSAMILALTSYAGAQDTTQGKTDDQNKKESISASEHARHCSKEMKAQGSTEGRSQTKQDGKEVEKR